MPPPSNHPETQVNLPADLDLLDPRLKPLCRAVFDDARVPGASVAVVVADKGYHFAHGLRSIASADPVTLDTGFNIGSCSKAFASATLASLVADGLCAWDDPISRWVPEFQLHDPLTTAMVTLRDLSANRLGLPGAGLTESGFDPRYPPEHTFERLRHTPSAFPFRSRFGYVNAGHSANAVAAGRITGKGFVPTLRERILAPLGMRGTSGGAGTPQDVGERAGWHVVLGGEPVVIDEVFTDQYTGSGGMVVSGRDALQWLRLHLNGGLVDGVQVVAREALLETHRPQAVAQPGRDPFSLFYPRAHMAAYALGWAVSDFEGHPLVMHSGSDLGVQAQTLLLPRSGIGAAVYANSIGGGPGALSAAFVVAATLLGLAPRDWIAHFRSLRPKAVALAEPAPVTLDAQDLERYVGSYEHPADGPLDIAVMAGRLTGVMRKAYRMRFDLLPLGEHRFAMRLATPEWQGVAADERLEVGFTVEAGRATRADMPGPFHGRPFLRVEAA
jgi:CubicO group peptidase (beta-lactamase class C family)